MREPSFSVAMPGQVNEFLLRHLLRQDKQEDLTFALWSPSSGASRQSALLHTVILPQDGDRQVHGNASFNLQYFERALQEAVRQHSGLALLHSHVGGGWQEMSADDYYAEQRLAEPAELLTGFPLIGLTVGTNATWSARSWQHVSGRSYAPRWCSTVRVVGPQLRVSYADHLVPPPEFRPQFRRTVSVWGEENHRALARLKVGIVGLGSVGMMVAEALARGGFEHFVLLDFDEVQPHNLDRLTEATLEDLGALKVEVGLRLISRSHTASRVKVEVEPFSVAEERGYRAVLDCDVIFSCVDRPRARQILNHFAYAHLIPVIDGGIQVWFRDEVFAGVDWQLQTVAPGRACLECLGAFIPADAETEKAGKLDDPSYLAGLPVDHRLKQNENVFSFSMNLASLEVLHLIALVTAIGGVESFGVQRFRYDPGAIEFDVERACGQGCDIREFVARGDQYFTYMGRDLGAEAARERQKSAACTK